ncbi:MAG: acyl-CoA dehydrogenase C-terminal domain-containing protein, partial [Pseudomonadota bacterium]
EKALDILTAWQRDSISLLGTKPEDAAGAATDYLYYSAYVILGILWLDMANVAAKNENKAIASGKRKTCDFYIKRLLGRKDVHRQVLFVSADDLIDVVNNEFDYV